jgi:hypothetical protein
MYMKCNFVYIQYIPKERFVYIQYIPKERFDLPLNVKIIQLYIFGLESKTKRCHNVRTA